MSIRALCRRSAALACSTAALVAQGQATEDWTHTLTLLGSNIYGTSVRTGADGAIYVAGYYPNYKIVVAKLAANGAPQWQTTFDNVGTREHATWMTLDAFGDVVVVGHHVTGGSMTPAGFVTLKYDAAGNLLWSRLVPSIWGSLARVATDANGDVVVLGRTWAAAGSGIVLMKYSASGTPLWTRTAGLSASNQDAVGGLTIDAAGNIYFTGGVLGTMLTLAYDAAGNRLWERSQPAAGSGADLTLDPAGGIYVVGAASGSTGDRNLVVKYDAAGTLLWRQTYPGIGARRVAVDRHGDVVIVGAVTPSGGYFDWVTQKLDAAGNLLWSSSYDHHRYNDEIPNALTIGPDDEIYVTGQGGPGPGTGNLSYLRAVTVRYGKGGAQEWAASSFTSRGGVAVALLHDGSVATVGDSTFTVFHYLQSGVWRSLGGALSGTTGLPHLEGTASPTGAAAVTLELSNARPASNAWFVLGTSRVNLPLLGGVLVPAPDLVLGALTLSQSGTLSLPLTWPAGSPRGFELTFQAWIGDPAAPAGLAASNALVGISR